MTSPINSSTVDRDWYPALYRSADSASREAQTTLLRLHAVNTVLLVAAAMWSTANIPTTWSAILGAVLFIGSLLCYLIGQHWQYRATWYQARALAESVKTAAWRLAMRADPFSEESEDANLAEFRSLLTELLQANKDISSTLSQVSCDGDQVTHGMLEVMRSEFAQKKDLYRTARIEEQHTWYATKARACRRNSRTVFGILILVYLIAIVLLLVKVDQPTHPFLPSEAFAVVASSLIGWSQLKRFDELASAYGLTAHELGIVKSKYQDITTADQLADFVSDAENAFSREHTQWAARRDH